jgi:hypothetical protein
MLEVFLLFSEEYLGGNAESVQEENNFVVKITICVQLNRQQQRNRIMGWQAECWEKCKVIPWSTQP